MEYPSFRPALSSDLIRISLMLVCVLTLYHALKEVVHHRIRSSIERSFYNAGEAKNKILFWKRWKSEGSKYRFSIRTCIRVYECEWQEVIITRADSERQGYEHLIFYREQRVNCRRLRSTHSETSWKNFSPAIRQWTENGSMRDYELRKKYPNV